MDVKKLKKISEDYVFRYMFKKLSHTIDNYREQLPAMIDIERLLISQETALEPYKMIAILFEMLRKHSEKSKLVAEIFENVKIDILHGIEPHKNARHQGIYYLDSINGGAVSEGALLNLKADC